MKPNVPSIKLFAAGMVLAVAGTATVSALAQPMGPGMHAGHGPGMGGRGDMMQLPERMLDQVNATPEQRTQIKQIMQAAAVDMKSQHASRQALHEQTMKLFTQPNVDANAVEALRQQMLAQHDQSSKRMMQAMLDASRVLTPEQRTKLADGMKQRRDMMQRHDSERRALEAPKS
jgi:Spy/CpxP family protein refolding chaperone